MKTDILFKRYVKNEIGRLRDCKLIHFSQNHTTISWFLNGSFHREDGPAYKHYGETEQWCIYGLLHREDGPAIEYSGGTKYWYIKGREYLEEDYWKALEKYKNKKNKNRKNTK